MRTKIEIGESMRNARLKAKMSQMDVVKDMGIRQGTLSQWENGNSGITLHYMWQLADLYGCSLDALVGRVYGKTE